MTLISILSLNVICLPLRAGLKPALYIHDERATAESTRGLIFFEIFFNPPRTGASRKGALTTEAQRHGLKL
jgi:hypothetical protein